MADGSRRATEDRVLAALPSWVNAISQLNRLIAERMGVTASDLDCLHVLNERGPATAAELAPLVGLTPGAVSRMIDRLEAAGCIERADDPHDRRRVLIAPTGTGLTRIAAYYDGLTARSHDDLEVLGADELEALLRFLDRSRRSVAGEIARLRREPDGRAPSTGPESARRSMTARPGVRKERSMTARPRTQSGLAWSLPNLAGPQALTLTSPDFAHDGAIPPVHASPRAGGQDLSPALTWSAVPNGTAQLLLVIEDPDAPTPTPFVHGLALLDPSVTGLAPGALNAATPADGVRLLRSGIGSGYFGPAPPKSHGPHRYAFQLFALATPITIKRGTPEAAKPRDVLTGAGDVLARGRLDGTYQRG